MPDLGPVVGALAEVLGPLLGAFLRTTVGMFTFTLVLAVLAYRTAAASGSPGKAVLAVVLVLGLGAVLGGVLAVKRAILTGLRHGVARLQLGQRTLGALFARMLGIPPPTGAVDVRRLTRRGYVLEAQWADEIFVLRRIEP